jgi:hypothetical protein
VPSKEEDEPGTLRIRGVSKPKAVAGAIANKLRAGESFKVNGASPPARPRSFPPKNNT